MAGDVRFAGFAQKPGAGGAGVGDGFLGGKGFRRNHKQRGFGAHLIEHVAQLGAVHGGNKVHVQPRRAVGRERRTHHQRPQIRAADADIDHVGNHLAGIAQPLAAAHRAGEVAHLREHRAHFGHHVFAVHHYRRVRQIAQRGVQRGTVFAAVDFFAGKHRGDFFRQTAFLGQRHQIVHHAVGNAVFRIIEPDAAGFQPVALGAAGVLAEQIAHMQVAGGFKVLLQPLPGGQVDRVHSRLQTGFTLMGNGKTE